MEILYNNIEYVQKLLAIAKTYPTYYGWGAFGAPASYQYAGRSYATNKERYKAPNAPNSSFLFDCAGYAYKALPWGFNGDRTKCYGGAVCPLNGKPLSELKTDNILAICSEVSTDFSQIEVGEVLYMTGHVGIYIGEGKATECTSNWTKGCLISEVRNCKIETGLEFKRTWLRHGKLPFVQYLKAPESNDTDKILEIEKINEIRNKLDELEAML